MEEIIWTFCTLPKILSPFTVEWVTIPQLEQNMRKLIIKKPEYNVEAWARHFILRFASIRLEQHKIEQVFNLHPEDDTDEDDIDGLEKHFIVEDDDDEITLVSDHLTAYLTKIAERAGRSVYNHFLSHYSSQHSLEDVWQIAFSLTTNPQDFFNNFHIFRSPDTSTLSPVYNYGIRRMQGRLKDLILCAATYQGRSNWFMLRDCTEIDFRKALQCEYQINTVDEYWQVLQCFREVYANIRVIRGSRSLPQPIQDQLQQIAELYQILSGEEISPEDIFSIDDDRNFIDDSSGITGTGILANCIRSLRSYFNLISETFSLDIPVGENHDICPIDMKEDPTTSPETIENSELNNQLTRIIPSLFEELNPDDRTLLLLHCGFQFTTRIIGYANSPPTSYIYRRYYTTISHDINHVFRRFLIFFAIDYLLSTLLSSSDSPFLATLRRLDYLSRTIVVLHYCMGIKKKEIASAGLLNMAIEKVREILDIHTPSEDAIDLDRSVIDNLIDKLPQLNRILREILRSYCSDVLMREPEITAIMDGLNDEQKRFLRLHYHPPLTDEQNKFLRLHNRLPQAMNQNAVMSPPEIADYLFNTDSEEVSSEIQSRLDESYQCMINEIKQWITNRIDVDLSHLNHVDEKVCHEFFKELSKFFPKL